MYHHKEDHHSPTGKVVIAFLAAAILPTVILSFFIVAASSPSSLLSSAAYFLLLLITTLPVAVAHVIMLGLPAYLIGIRFHTINMWSCTIVGFMIGALPSGISSWHNKPNFGWIDFIPTGLSGAIGGAVFWILWQFWVREKSN